MEAPAVEDLIQRIRVLCLEMPAVTERVSHGEPAWFVRRAPQFVIAWNHHHDDRVAFHAAALPGAQSDWVGRDPERFYVPPYVGGRGWVGVYLDVPTNWDDVADIIEDAYRAVAPVNLIAQLDS